MGITPLVVRQKEFTTRFRGFDVQEVDYFLEEVAKEFDHLNHTIQSLHEENHRLNLENQGYRKRENSMKNAMIQSQKVLDQMKENAKKSSQVIIANAEVEAEKMLNRAHKRLSQLHSDIIELKRQRIQLEMQISAVLESHSKMLEMTKEENKAADETDSTLKFIKQAFSFKQPLTKRAREMAEIDAFFKLMHEQGASDLHLASGQQPAIRLHGDIERIKYETLTSDKLRGLLYEITSQEKIKVFEETGDVDFGYEIPGLARYRANYFMQKSGISAVFREIPSEILTAEQLGLPPVISKLADLPRGLVLVTGPTGSGKSTTLAAIIDQANRSRKDHIITVEDPIEFVHRSQNCIVNQREVGLHTQTFSSALRGALREDPDIILVGELRDLETISLAIEAASTGHLVFGTLHTSSAAKTVDRIIEVFPSTEQAQIRSTLSDGLRAVVAQTLFKRIDKKGRCAALEILVATPAVRNLIREAKTHQIASMIQTGKQYGMQLLDDAIMHLYKKGWISPDEAYGKANNKSLFRPFLKKPPADFTEA